MRRDELMCRFGEISAGALLVHEQRQTRKLTIMLFHGTSLLEITPAWMCRGRMMGRDCSSSFGSLHMSAHISVNLFTETCYLLTLTKSRYQGIASFLKQGECLDSTFSVHDYQKKKKIQMFFLSKKKYTIEH